MSLAYFCLQQGRIAVLSFLQVPFPFLFFLQVPLPFFLFLQVLHFPAQVLSRWQHSVLFPHLPLHFFFGHCALTLRQSRAAAAIIINFFMVCKFFYR